MTAAVRAALVESAKSVVLCVEDDPSQLALLKETLEADDLAVLQARSGVEALRLFRRHPISLVVIDQRLGNKQMTGAQFAREAKAIKPNVPVVLRTDSPPESMGSWDVFINKGEPAESFMKIVRDLIERYQH